MINVQELMIDNWVECDGTFFPIDAEVLPVIWRYPDQYNPITITHDILKECSFEVHKNSNEFWTFWALKNNWYISESNHSELSAGVKSGLFYYGDTFIEIEFLHQLQNIYFWHGNRKDQIVYSPK